MSNSVDRWFSQERAVDVSVAGESVRAIITERNVRKVADGTRQTSYSFVVTEPEDVMDGSKATPIKPKKKDTTSDLGKILMSALSYLEKLSG